jgi:hypothetical protein
VTVAKFESVPIGELRHRLPAKLLPLVEEYREKLEKLGADRGAELVLEKGKDPKDLRKAVKAAVSLLNRRIRFPVPGRGRVVELLSGGEAGTAGEASEGRDACGGWAEEERGGDRRRRLPRGPRRTGESALPHGTGYSLVGAAADRILGRLPGQS